MGLAQADGWVPCGKGQTQTGVTASGSGLCCRECWGAAVRLHTPTHPGLCFFLHLLVLLLFLIVLIHIFTSHVSFVKQAIGVASCDREV